MTVDKLMDAIGDIDDSYVEEFAYGRPRFARVPWGLIATAACFCLVIGATIFMQSMGILPHLNGPSEATSQPTTPSTTETTIPQPTVALPLPESFFAQMGSLNNIALGHSFADPEDVMPYFLLGKGDIGKGVDLTEQEKKLLDSKLHYGLDYREIWRLTPEQMDNIFWSCYGLTWKEVASNFDPGMYGDPRFEDVPVYLEETGYYYGYCQNTVEGYEIVDIETVYYDDGTINMYYTNQSSFTKCVAKLRIHETGYYILSNTFIERYEETTDPTEPPETRPSVEEFFSDRGNWQNYIILATFSDPTQIDLHPDYLRAMDGESMTATDLEHEKLASVVLGYDRNKLFRATKAQLDEVMLTLFNITTDQLTTDWERNFTYLAETGCYYARGTTHWGYSVEIFRTEECDDGTILMYYSLSNGEEPHRVARLQPHATGYYILSNEHYVDNTGKTEDQIAMEALFKNWYNQALTCEYDSPEQIGLITYFYMGLENEKRVTDEEKEQLKNMQGFSSPAGDIYRLPPDKMNAVLEECFGITLEDLNPTSFNGLAYLESTNCYYFKASAPNGIENFTADKVEKQSDGTIDVYYNISYKGDYVVTVKPYGDGYRVLSNRCINSTPSIPQIPVEPTGDTELEKLFAGYAKVPEKEATKKMVDAFLADPDTFVQLLAKQTRSRAILGVLSRNVTDNHPQISAYRAAVSSMLAKDLPEKEKVVVYGMAVYSGLSNYIPDTPTEADYRFILDVMDQYDYHGETVELLRKFCIEDAAGLIAVMVQDREDQTIYIARITALASQEELEQIKESVMQRKEELSKMNGEDIQDQIECAETIIESCGEEIE